MKRIDKNLCVLFNFSKDQSFGYAMALSVLVYRCNNENWAALNRGWVSDFSDKTLENAEFNCIKNMLAVQRSSIQDLFHVFLNKFEMV